jgi:chromosome segregation ATPase
MKRKLTNAQMQDSIAELTDDVTELKDTMQETKVKQSLAGEQFDIIFAALHHASQNISEITEVQNRTTVAIEKLLAAQARANKRQDKSDERLARLETTVQRLSDTVDRYLSARLNGGSKN